MRRLTAACIAALVAVAAACSDGGSGGGTTTSEIVPTTLEEPVGSSTPPEVMAPIAQPGEWFVDFASRSLGTLRVDDLGCWWLDDALLVFPQGSQISADGRSVVTTLGSVIPSGAAVEARARLVGVDGWPGGVTGRWQQHVDRCDPGAPFLVVADTLVEDAYDPRVLDDAELVGMFESADFDLSWGCGYRYAISTGDQRVAVIVEVPWDDFEPASVVLPDDRFEVTVQLGKDLFANHCDDVIEPFEPEPVIAARWPVTQGHFDHRPPSEEDACGSDAEATVVLEGAVVSTPLGERELAPLTIVNSAFGCLPG